MLSSISSFNPIDSKRGIIALLISLAISYGLVEVLAGFGFTHISKIQRRIDQEYRETLKIRPIENGRPSMLLCGNSLLLEGVNLPAIHNHLDKMYSIHRFVIESTEYLDWYFGLQRLFREGMKPSYVVLFLTTTQLVHNTTRGEYFAHFLMSPQDIMELKEKAKLDTTTASDYLLASQSPWLGAKSEIRKWILGRLLSDFSNMTDALRSAPPSLPSDNDIWRVVPDRLRALQRIVGQNGGHLIIVVPPQSEEAKSELIQKSGHSTHIVVLLPIRMLPASNFTDGFHLNSIGCSLFTEKLVEELPQAVR